MLYTLDTNVISLLVNENVRVLAWWKEVRLAGRAVRFDALSYVEVRRGLALPRFARKFEASQNPVGMQELLPLDVNALDISADIYRTLRERGAPLEDADILIAGIAIAHDATLVTRNLKHFERVEGLRLESLESFGEA